MKFGWTKFRWFAGFAVFVVLGFTAFNLYSLQVSLNNIQTIERSKAAWVVSRTEFEYLRFKNALLEYGYGVTTGDELRLRTDIMWSRLDINRSATTANRLAELDIDLSVLDRLQSVLEQADPQFLAIDGENRQNFRGLYDEFSLLDEAMRILTHEAFYASSNQAFETRMSLVSVSNTTNVLAVLTVTALIIMASIFAFDAKRHRAVSDENMQLLIKARAGSEAKTQFISVINHELRTPLTSIAGAIGLLRGEAAGELNPKMARLIEISWLNCESLNSLIGDLLEIDKAQAGKLELNLTKVHVSELLKNAVLANVGYAQRHGVNLVSLPVADDIYTDIDRKRIMQVMANLISNAVKFSTPGGSVELFAEASINTLIISVRDHGIGIRSESFDAIFERFHQEDGGIDRKAGGTGLGLSIARGIVEGHGGTLTVSSELGLGSVFALMIPRTAPGAIAI